ncbi:MAG: SDR family oxidoreductase, partial [Deltaproteobacteria bacterium]|nr:SDR family oxidoreductase [Deltaproteobacteria bacterium]
GDLHPEMVLPLDASKEESITALMAALGDRFGHLDGLVHSIASAKRGELGGRFSDITPDGYQFAHLVSSYSLISLTRHAKPLMQGGGSVITLTYLGAERAVANYNVMGSAKAALEANVRYLAMELGESSIRVNAVSAGPIRTLASAGVKDFIELLREARERAPLRRNVELEEVANVSGFLLSPLSSGMTGQVVYVDCGYNIAG